MAMEKLSEGIRRFAADTVKLEALICEKLPEIVPNPILCKL